MRPGNALYHPHSNLWLQPATPQAQGSRSERAIISQLDRSIEKTGPIDMVPSRIIEFNFLAAPASYLGIDGVVVDGWIADSGRSD